MVEHPPYGSDVPVTFLGDKYALVTPDAFDRLPEYSTTLPTGTAIGKRWKAHRMSGWRLGEYVEHPDPGKVKL